MTDVVQQQPGNLGRFWTYDNRRERPRNRMASVLPSVPFDQLPASKFWPLFQRPLNQGNTSSCVGHAWKHVALMAKIRNLTGLSALEIYAAAQQIDPWPGEEPYFQGTSTEAGAHVMRTQGIIERWVWPDTVEDIIRFVLTEGPVVVGTNWWSAMDSVGLDGYLKIGGHLRGGHCYVIDYWNRLKDEGDVLNSWGFGTWGKRHPVSGIPTGRAKITRATLQALIFEQAGEACGPTEIRRRIA